MTLSGGRSGALGDSMGDSFSTLGAGRVFTPLPGRGDCNRCHTQPKLIARRGGIAAAHLGPTKKTINKKNT